MDEAVRSGARMVRACEEIGLPIRTIQRWRHQPAGDGRLVARHREPANKLSPREREQVLATLNHPEYRELGPKQVVPRLADQDTYLASESTMYRILREEKLQRHRERSRPASHHRPNEQRASGPEQLWSWDITYLRTTVRGMFFYLYLIMDVWSRKIVGLEVHDCESSEYAAELFSRTCRRLDLDPEGLVLHADNGSPMKGSTMLSTLQRLGVVASFSRPGVSNDNAYSEALFRTLKYRPEYPSKPFTSLEQARRWASSFVHWYNSEHRHSEIGFVTPEQRHNGQDCEVLAKRHAVYQRARDQHPERWSRNTRRWEWVDIVTLNPRSSSAYGARAA